jgi:hypothetical protein
MNLPKDVRGKTKTTAVYGTKVMPTKKRNLQSETGRFVRMSMKAMRANRPGMNVTSQ